MGGSVSSGTIAEGLRWLWASSIVNRSWPLRTVESLLTGAAPLAGCLTGRLAVHPLGFRAADALLGLPSAADTLTAYGIPGGVPLCLLFFRPDLSVRDSILQAIASPSARLYVEPQVLLADSHRSFEPSQALAALPAIAHGRYRWSGVAEATRVSTSSLTRTMEPLTGDLALVEKVLPVTESHENRTYYTQYHLSDSFLRSWLGFIEPNQGQIEFGSAAVVVDGITKQLPDFMGRAFESMARQWTRTSGDELPVSPARVGSWWVADHELGVVGLDDAG